MSANAAWYDLLSQNLASSSVPGFKRQVAGFQQFRLNSSLPNPTETQMTYPVLRVGTDDQQGALRSTGARSDLALAGAGFLGFILPDQSVAVSRDGELRVNGQGILVGKSGYPLMGANGPIQLDPNSTKDFVISEDGVVSQGNVTVGEIPVWEPAGPAPLAPLGGGLFSVPAGQLRPSPATTLRQGFLETANTSSMQEMSDLLQAVRHFEANQRVVMATDERLAKTVQELGAVPAAG